MEMPVSVLASNAEDVKSGDGGLRWSGYLLGFALGGFADGILFHQVLQWHHLMSLVDLPFLATLEGQVVADGLFHVATYLIAIVGLWLLWRNRVAGAEPGSGRTLLATFLIGFGVWHIVDNILVHWLLGWHHIRLPPYNPILWDTVTFVIGIAFVLWGWFVWRRPSGGSGARRGSYAALLLATATLIAGPVSALPPPGPAFVTVQFRPETTPAEAFLAIAAVDGRVVSAETDTNTWVVEIGRAGEARNFANLGARVIGNALPIGCFAPRRT